MAPIFSLSDIFQHSVGKLELLAFSTKFLTSDASATLC